MKFKLREVAPASEDTPVELWLDHSDGGVRLRARKADLHGGYCYTLFTLEPSGAIIRANGLSSQLGFKVDAANRLVIQ